VPVAAASQLALLKRSVFATSPELHPAAALRGATAIATAVTMAQPASSAAR
jgi:hypothetical protein